MSIVKVKQNGKLKLFSTIAFNFGPRVPAKNRKTIAQIIQRRKYAERDARLVKMF